jgi:beta-mannanase
VRRGAQDAGLRRLTAQIRGLRPAPILRPMPEPNTPWYAWSGTVNRNTPAAYVAAWKRVRRVVRGAGGRRVLMMWAPYARSVPATAENAIPAYFPGLSQVDVVGTSGYNFGDRGGLAWTEPDALFEDAYRQISALAPKPFWIAETGSTATGGSREEWIGQLSRLGTAIPNLAGIVWFDVRDRNGDFRVSASKRSRGAFKAFAARVRTP